MPIVSGYAKEMLDAEMDKWADHPQGKIAQAIIAGVKAALFGPPSREVAGTCGAENCNNIADRWGEDFCNTCWGPS